jgi:hypothetical protein
MAEPDQAGNPDMTPGEQIIQLFLTVSPPGSNLDWLVGGLLAVAADTPSVTIRVIPDSDIPATKWHLQVEQQGRVSRAEGPGSYRLFRPLLARLAVIAAEETGIEFQPYGGRYSLVRPGTDGPIRLDVEFSNTTVSQHLSITRAAVPTAAPPRSGDGTATPPQPAEPAGA